MNFQIIEPLSLEANRTLLTDLLSQGGQVLDSSLNYLIIRLKDGSFHGLTEDWIGDLLLEHHTYQDHWATARQVVFGDAIVGLFPDGTVWSEGKNLYGQGNVIDATLWKDVKKIVNGCDCMAGLTPDGRVLFAGYGRYNPISPHNWRDIIDISSNHGETILGLKEDGTVLSAYGYTENRNAFQEIPSLPLPDEKWLQDYEARYDRWTDIQKLLAATYYTLGLRQDGTVAITTEYSPFRTCKVVEQVRSWKNVADILCFPVGEGFSSYDLLVAIHRDGRVSTAAKENHFPTDHWQNVCQVVAGKDYLAGLSYYGQVQLSGPKKAALSDAQSWTHIRQLAAIPVTDFLETPILLGLRADGTVVSSGGEMGDLSHWCDIREIHGGLTSKEQALAAGLRSDGTVVTAGNTDGFVSTTENWKDICTLFIAFGQVFGINQEGTVFSTAW